MNKQQEKEREPRPDEPKPQRPMQPVMERAPEPDPATRAKRPETRDTTKDRERFEEAERKKREVDRESS